MKDLAFVDDDALLEIYLTSKATFEPQDYAALGVILEAGLPEEVKSESIKVLMSNALDRYVAKHGQEPFPPIDFS